jgi:uncharacterized membrane protein YtjA (UPF0391 family)
MAAISDLAEGGNGPHAATGHCRTRRFVMLYYTVVFLVVALMGALFGFGSAAAGAVGVGKFLFIAISMLTLLSFLFGLVSRP